MTKYIKQTIILSAIILLTACGKSEQKIKQEKEVVIKQKTDQLKTSNEKAITDLTHKYSSISGWNKLKTFTYVLQEMFIDEKKPISFEGELKDITKSDTTYYLKVHNTGWHYNQNSIALISITPEKFTALKTKLKSTNHSTVGCFIFKVSKISSASPEIKSDFELDGEDSYSYLSYDFDETLLIFKGELVDFYLNETVDTDNE